jgi:hypothetical protein
MLEARDCVWNKWRMNPHLILQAIYVPTGQIA